MTVDRKEIKEYLLKNIITLKSNITDSEPLFSTGLIDSFGMLDLLFFIREQYGVSIEDFEIADNGIDSLDELVDYMNKKE